MFLILLKHDFCTHINLKSGPKRHGISSFIAVLLLLGLAIASGVIIYSFVMGNMGNLKDPDQTAIGTLMVVDSTVFTDEGFTVYLRNSGDKPLQIDCAYVNGERVQGTGYSLEVNGPGTSDDVISEGSVGTVIINIPGGFGSSVSYKFKVVSKDGAQACFSRKGRLVETTVTEDWLTGWGHRVKLTLDSGDVDEGLTDFPVMVHLGTSVGSGGDDVSFIFDELGGDCDRLKIAVTTSDGETECFVEVEGWDDGGEEAYLWVKVPNVSSTEDTELYLYYDHTQPDNSAQVGDPGSTPAEQVWDGDFLVVTHMKDDPDYRHTRDSTSHRYVCTKTANNQPPAIQGLIGEAQDFDGNNDFVEVYPLNRDVTEVSAEFWMRSSDLSKQGTPISCYSTAHSQNNEFLIFNYQSFRLYIRGSNVATGVTATDGQWHHFTAVWQSTGGIARFYRDGVEVFTGTIASGQTVNLENIIIGQEQDALHGGFQTSQAFLGLIDEVRFSETVRTAAWIKATFETGRDHLFTFGSEETS